jgi:ribosome-associated protein
MIEETELEEKVWAERPNKTQEKLELDILMNLGKSIAALSKDQFEAITLPDTFRQGIVEVRKLGKGGAIKRQFKYIAKLLREMSEEEVDGLHQALERQLDKDRAATARLHQLEQWRDKLVAEGDGALGEFVSSYPQADRQHMRQLQRKAKQELEKGKSPIAARKIFQYIKEITLEG